MSEKPEASMPEEVDRTPAPPVGTKSQQRRARVAIRAFDESVRSGLTVDIVRLGIVLACFAFVGYVVLYFTTHVWQTLVALAGLVLVILTLARAVRHLRRERREQAGYWTLLSVWIVFAFGELLFVGITVFYAISLLLVVGLLVAVLRPRRIAVWVAGLVLYALFDVLVNRFPLLPRYPLSQSLALQIYVYVMIGLLVAMLFVLFLRTRARVGGIRARLLTAFTIVLILPLIGEAVGAGFGFRGSQRNLRNQLTSVAALKEQEVLTWVETLQGDVAALLVGEDLEQVQTILRESPDSAAFRRATGALRERLGAVLPRHGRFEEYFLMDDEGWVVLSTEPAHEGALYSTGLFYWSYEQFVNAGATPFVYPPVYYAMLDKTAVVAVQPLMDEQGALLGFLCGRANLSALEEIMRESSGLGATGQTYLVGTNYTFIAGSQDSAPTGLLRSMGIEAAIRDHSSGVATYDNYRGESVVGVYRWIPDLQVVLLVEQNSTEAFRSAYFLLFGGLLIIVIAVLTAVVIALTLTRSIADPLRGLTETAVQIAAGDLTRVARVEREDEMGVLAQAFNDMTARLRELIGSLEQRVAERTRDLARRSSQLEAAARVARGAVAVQDLDTMLQGVAHLIAEQFGFYHVGIFLLDEEGEYAVLQATNSEGGQRMLARGHRLRVGEEGIVGYVTATGEARIALDVGADAHFFDNPDLPLTRSEIALPLRVGERIIGALDVQSIQEAAFSEDDVAVLGTLADQVAVAIQNARLIAQTKQALAEVEALHRQYLQREWARVGVESGALFYEYARSGVPSVADLALPEMNQALEQGQTIVLSPGRRGDGADGAGVGSALAVPIRLRGQVIGVIDLQEVEAERFWAPDEVRLVETIGDQMAQTLENVRLFEETRRRATQLATAAEVSQAASSILSLGELLPRTAELIRRRFDLYYVGVFLVEENGQWAVLRAGTGEAGQRMLQQGYRLAVGGDSMIGWCTAQGEARIASDVGEEATRFENPLLPDTRSEIALPLLSRGRVIGAMTIQSSRPAAFSEEDVAVLQTMSGQLANDIENARLFSETEQALKETQELYEASRAIGAATTPTEVRSVLVDYASRTGVDAVRLLLLAYDPNGQAQEIAMAEGWTVDNRPAQPFDTRLPLSSYPLTQFLSPTDMVVVEDVYTDPRATEPVRLIMEISRLRSFAVVPIAVGQQYLGGLFIGRDLPHRYTEKTLRGLWTLCGQAAIALENLRLLEETRRRAEELEAINELGRTITSVLDLDVLLEQVVDITKTRFGYYFVSIFLLQGGSLQFWGGSPVGASDRRLPWRSIGLPLDGTGLTVEAARTGLPVLCNDVLNDPRYISAAELADTRSELDVPIEVKGRVIGVLDVQSDRLNAFARTDIALLQSLASQVGVAMENARLFAETQAEAQRRALINEVMQAASRSLDPADLLHRTGEVISRRLEQPSALFLWEPEAAVLRPVAFHDDRAMDVPLPEGLLVTREMNPTLFRAMEERQPRILESVDGLQGALAEMAAQLRIQSAVYVPLISRGQVLGALDICRVAGQPPQGMEEVTFAEIVAGNLSVALENARLYQDAVHTAERLAEVDRLKSQFLANMSHELRTPLNSIIGFSRVILKGIDGPLTDLQKQDLEAIYNSGQHLLNLINDILDISKIEAGKMELSFEEVDLKDVIRGVMSTAIALVKDKPVDLQQIVPEDLPVIVGDGRRIRQVLLNMVSNAARFTDRGFIRVEARFDERFVTISVADSGIGIAPDKLSTIFDAFTQADSSPSRKYGGTGLGLAISKSFVALHGGEVWVESQLGEGSTFYFTLPILGPASLRPPEPEGGEEAVAEAGEAEGGRVVLCVDDDEGVITLFRRYLNKQGYRVVGLTDPTRVLEEVRRLRPYAITLDVMMPGKDGWQVIQELKDDPETCHIPVVMCTIVGEQGRGMSLGAADYLVKPILEQDLLRALDRLDREGGRHRVLVVDDQTEDRNLLRRMIESQEGYEVIEAASGQDAIAVVRQARPHIIVLDLMMPDVDGFAVLEALKSDEFTRSIPIIVVTAKELSEEERGRLNHNIEALIQKGLLERDELLADVAAALQKLGRAVLDGGEGEQSAS